MIVCKNCGLPDFEHCLFEPRVIPEGCVCPPGEWKIDPIPAPCDHYQGDGQKCCVNCEHDERCHAKKA